MTDNLVQLLGRHHRCGVITINCECGWWPEDHLPGHHQYKAYDEHLANMIRQHRTNLPVITRADEPEANITCIVCGRTDPYEHFHGNGAA